MATNEGQGQDQVRRHQDLHRATAGRHRRVVGLEQMEERLTPSTMGADLAMLGASALSPSQVVAQYEISGSALTEPVALAVYRSADETFDSSDALVGRTILSGTMRDVGAHDARVDLAEPLVIDPSQRFVLAVADPDDQVTESDDGNNVASFRKWVVAAVTHGLESEPFGGFPVWVSRMTDSLMMAGYDAAIPFDWAALSDLPAPGLATMAAQGLAAQVEQVIAGLPLGSGDVVDVHLIGHSRGGGVVSQVAALLPTEANPLQGGVLKLSLLDPHPARNDPLPDFSHSTGPIGVLTSRLFEAFQARADDPPIVIPAATDRAEIFYQRTPAPQTIDLLGQFVNSWGKVPVGGDSASVVYHDVTAQTRSHSAVQDFYQNQVVPTLATAEPVPVPPVSTPDPPVDGGPAFPNRRLGVRYELGRLRANGIPFRVGVPLLQGVNLLNQQVARGQLRGAAFLLGRLDRFVTLQQDRGIPAPIAANLRAVFQQARSLAPTPPTNPIARLLPPGSQRDP